MSGNREGNNTPRESASAAWPRGVKDPRHAEKPNAREPGDPVAARGRKVKSETWPAEVVEGRPRTKENTQEPNPCRTPRRESGPSGLERVREAAKQDGNLKFTALPHHVSIHLLRDSYHSLKKQAAPGVGGMTWEEYGGDPEFRPVHPLGSPRRFAESATLYTHDPRPEQKLACQAESAR